MVLRSFVAASLLCVAARADFSYEQTSKMTGGSMMGMMKVAGAFSKAAREPMRSTVMVKGDRMAMLSGDRINVIDLNAETFTDIDLQKKTYATITFAEMGRAMAKMAEKMGQQRKENQGADVQFKAEVKPTGATKTIAGLNTKQTIVTLSMEGTDQKSGNKGAMDFVMDMWLAPSMPGYEEVRSFYTRMAQKVSWNPAGGMMGAMMSQHAKGMSELVKEMSKLEGIPVVQITRVGAAGAGMPSEADMAAAQQQQQQQPTPSAKDAAGDAAAGAALSRSGRLGGLAGGLGGLGGFGRRKKTEEKAPQEAPPPPPQQQASGAAPGSLMEMTTELTGFSSAPVDASKMAVPAGFKQVEHDMAKALK